MARPTIAARRLRLDEPMGAIAAAIIVILVIDQAIKLLLRRLLGSSALTLGGVGSLRIVQAPIWLARIQRRPSMIETWAWWAVSTAALVAASAVLPGSSPFVALLVGGSLSHSLESSVYGSVSDYICLYFWPPFDLADVAIAAGVVGVAAHVMLTMHAALLPA